MAEPSNSCAHVFGTPDVRVTIFLHSSLSLQDLANVARVCRVWFTIVSPFLWENVNMIRTKAQQDAFQAGIYRHARHIKTFTSSSVHGFNWLARAQLLVNLTSIEIVDRQDGLKKNLSIYKVITQNPRLKTIRLYPCLGVGLFTRVAKGLMFSKPGFLTTLDFGRLNLTVELKNVLNRHSSTLQNLTLDGCPLVNDTFVGIQPLPNLKTLRFHDVKQGTKVIQSVAKDHLALLRAARKLTELDFATDTQYLSFALRHSLQRMKSLKTLTANCLHGVELTDERTAKMLQVMPPSLEKLTLRRCRFEDSSNEIWRNLVTMVQLVSINLNNCRGITEITWLTTLKCSPLLVEIGGGQMARMDAYQMVEPWACMGLQKLEISIRIGHESLKDFLDQDMAATDRVVLGDCEKSFTQLGMLPRLEFLKLKLERPKLDTYAKSLEATEPEGEKELNPALSDLEQKFVSIWSLLSTCTEMKKLNGVLLLPRRMVNVVKLEQVSRNMWGEDVKVHLSR